MDFNATVHLAAVRGLVAGNRLKLTVSSGGDDISVEHVIASVNDASASFSFSLFYPSSPSHHAFYDAHPGAAYDF